MKSQGSQILLKKKIRKKTIPFFYPRVFLREVIFSFSVFFKIKQKGINIKSINVCGTKFVLFKNVLIL